MSKSTVHSLRELKKSSSKAYATEAGDRKADGRRAQSDIQKNYSEITVYFLLNIVICYYIIFIDPRLRRKGWNGVDALERSCTLPQVLSALCTFLPII